MTNAALPICNTDARAAARRRVRLRAIVREAGSSRIDIDLVDLSATGFQFASDYPFSTGVRVFLTIPNLQPLEAHIAWRRRDRYGCKLSNPLHIAIFESLVQRFED